MTRILVLGGNGMIGHRIWLAARDRFETWATLRTSARDHAWDRMFDGARVIEGVAAEDPASVDRALDAAKSDVVINAVGIVKQHPEGNNPGPAFTANTFLPHYLRARCDAAGVKLIQVSTDCVFNGTKGGYSEDDDADALDVYGLTKRLGEVEQAPHLTIRTSAVGRSLGDTRGLLEWFLAAPREVTGYRRAIFSGLTTQVLADTVMAVIEERPELTGLWHVGSEPISKFDLLLSLAEVFGRDAHIVPSDEPVIDRSLDDSRFRAATGLARPTWPEMLEGLRADRTPYHILRDSL